MSSLTSRLTERIKIEAGDGCVVCFVSGGVDSSVAAVLARKALGNRLHAFLIDNGFLRKGEAEEALSFLRNAGLSVSRVDAKRLFFASLRDTHNSEERRTRYGKTMFSLAQKIARKNNAHYVVLGTVREDLAVSGEREASSPRKIGELYFIEPLAGLSKRRVRKLAREMRLRGVAGKSHFPSPGLSVRVSGKLNRERIMLVRRLTALVEEFHGLEGWRFPFLLEEKLDGRYCVVLRIVKSENGLTGRPAAYRKASLLAREILRRENSVGRVFLDLTPKPPASIELM